MPATITIKPWLDPVVDVLGHDPRSRYVETFWLPTLGPPNVSVQPTADSARWHSRLTDVCGTALMAYRALPANDLCWLSRSAHRRWSPG